jgi:hypothetical protein
MNRFATKWLIKIQMPSRICYHAMEQALQLRYYYRIQKKKLYAKAPEIAMTAITVAFFEIYR